MMARMAKDRAEMVAAVVEDASTEGRSEREIEVMLTGMGRDTLERMSLVLIAANRKFAQEHAQMLVTLTAAQRIGSSQLEELRIWRIGELAPLATALGVDRQRGVPEGAVGVVGGRVLASIVAKVEREDPQVRMIQPRSAEALAIAIAAVRLFLGR